jgi:hypothetical protein
MENKIILIHVILDQHILTDNYYRAIFDVLHKEYNVNLLETDDYATEISAYKQTMKTKLSQFMDRMYTYEELSEMVLDSNSPLYYRVLTEEYKGLIAHETRIFSTRLREKFAEDGVSKKTIWQKAWQSVTSFLS